MPDVLIKHPNETRVYTFDFHKLTEIVNGDTITGSPTLIVTVDQPGLNLGTPAIATGSTATVSISGGNPGATYTLICTASTAGGSTLQCLGKLVISSW